jgi:hypothetical protein
MSASARPEDFVNQEEFRPDPFVLSSAEFVAGFVPPDYLIDGLLQRRYCYSLTAQTGNGKTALALLFAKCVGLGHAISDRAVERGRVLFFAGENPDDIRMRWIAMADAFKFDVKAIDVHFVPGVFSISAMKERVAQEVTRLGGMALVIVDTSAAYFLGESENDNVQMGAHARMLRELTTLPGGPTVLVNCHPAKGAGPDNLLPRGGGAFLAEVDGNLTCSRDDMLVTLHSQGKFRGPNFDPMSFELQSTTTPLLTDSKGRNIFTVYANPLSAEEQREKAGASRNDEDALLLVLLDEEADHSLSAIARQCRWFNSKGDPYKSKAQRLVDGLRAQKLVDDERGTPVLTDKGKAAAKKVEYNRKAAGASYG